jgi:chemotaxis protein CheX
MQLISDSAGKAVQEVFGTMVSLRVERVQEKVGLPNGPVALAGVVSSVGIAGRISGTLYLNMSDRLACLLVERMIGEVPADAGAPEVIDVIGELTNMTTGAMKAHTSQRGYNGWLTTPVVLRGSQITVEPKDAAIAVYNQFHLPELREQVGIHAFVKLS